MTIRNYGGLMLLALAVALGGCASNRQLLVDPVRNAELQAELSREPFRGRWWDLYDRSLIYQKYELWELAEQDIRTALSIRDEDQRWARTYGLHFMPEYFPNRELGIVLLKQNRIDEAVQYLEASMDGLYTARAAHYLDAAHAERVAMAELDSGPPTIEFDSPSDGAIVGTTSVDVRAIVRDDTYVAEVKVNGESVPLRFAEQEVLIERVVLLEPGANTVEIEMTDIVGNRTVEHLALQRDTDGPAVSFNTPLVIPGKITGVAFDPSAVSALYIGDLPATLRQDSDGRTTFEFAVESVSNEFIPQFRCDDALGNSTTGLLPIDGVLTQASYGDIVLASSTTVVPQSDEIVALYRGDELIGVFRTAAASAPPDTPSIHFANLLEGQRYLKDDVVVSLEIQAADALQSVAINGEPVETLIPGRGSQRISRRIRIEEEGNHRIAATVVDVRGNVGSAEVTIERRLPQIEEVSARLSIALLGDLSRSDDISLQDQAEFLRSELPFAFDERGRFNVVDRDSIETVLEEQQLVAALGSVKERQRLGQLDVADFLLIADIRKYAENLEILLHAIDSMTSREVVVDVYGPANNSQELRALIHDLALRLEQEFPRVRGNLTRIASSGDRVFSDLSRSDRIRESMYCVVYRPQEVIDPKTKLSLGVDLIPVAQGTLRDIQRQGSSIQLLLNEADDPDGIRPQPNDLVVTK